jgi:hypothetical protein
MADDAGQPMQLALNKSESPVQMASAEPAPMSAPVVAAAAPAAPAPELPVSQWSARELQSHDPAPQQAELPAIVQSAGNAPAPVFHAIATPMPRAPAVMASKALAPSQASAVKMASAKPAKVGEPRGASGTHVMQLGAFLSEKNALRAKKARP